MSNNFVQKKILDLVNAYKISAIFSLLAVKKNDYNAILTQNKTLKNIWEEVLKTVKKSFSKSIFLKLQRMDFNNLPDELSMLNIVDIYNKLLSLKYLEFKPDNPEEKVIISKLSIEFNSEEELAYISLAKSLYDSGKYPEAVSLCEYIKTFSETAPVWEILGDVYRDSGIWGKSVEAYKNYIEINDGDLEVADKLEAVYKEALK